jgi:hypothetical protein
MTKINFRRLIELSEDCFDRWFPLLINHLNPYASWAFGEQHGRLFETYGDKLAFVRAQDPRAIWTLVDGDEGCSMVSGMHFVNRIGYLVSTVLLANHLDVEVLLESGEDHEEVA